MASWMVHLRIADELLARTDGSDETAFIVGNIAPDSGVPSADWKQFFPPKTISHFKTKSDDERFFDIDKFKREYFNEELIKGYDNKTYSFFLGYYVHLLSDIEWTEKIYCRNVSEELAAAAGITKWDLLWKNKGDWYDLDFKYLRDHPDFHAFNVYETAKDIENVYMDIFSPDAFSNRRDYICGFYRGDEHGDLDREYHYLTPEGADDFVKDSVEKIVKII